MVRAGEVERETGRVTGSPGPVRRCDRVSEIDVEIATFPL
jgi:hypothetical protein